MALFDRAVLLLTCVMQMVGLAFVLAPIVGNRRRWTDQLSHDGAEESARDWAAEWSPTLPVAAPPSPDAPAWKRPDTHL